MDERLVVWLRKRIGMAVQCASALDKPVGGLLSQFSPMQLLALSESHYRLLTHLLESGDDRGVRLLAEGYQLHAGYEEKWRP